MSASLSLSELLSGFAAVSPEWDKATTGISLDSRTTCPGEVFFACRGAVTDGLLHAEEAVQKGAAAVVYDAQSAPERIEALVNIAKKYDVPMLGVFHLQTQLGPIAARFYGMPSRQLQVWGVTGTNGKTSVTHFLAQAFTALQKPSAVLGTLGYGVPGRLQPLDNTTPGPFSLQAILRDFWQRHFFGVAMEVSSHALTQHRVHGTEFTMAILTNVTQDHLDFHGTMENYFSAKEQLFHWPRLKAAVINLDDAYGQRIWASMPGHIEKIGYSVVTSQKKAHKEAKVFAHKIQTNGHGMAFECVTPWGSGLVTTGLLGTFNVSNLLATVAALGLESGIKDSTWEILSNLHPVPGRLECLGGSEKPLVVVDYAHTPDALQQVLEALRKHCTGKLWCIFGCGGDRDKTKRPLMGQVAERIADAVVLTDDNPRTEASQVIVQDILSGCAMEDKIGVCHDRYQAITQTIAKASRGDIILIAGKGHETYQVVGTKRLPFSDKVIAQEALNLH